MSILTTMRNIASNPIDSVMNVGRGVGRGVAGAASEIKDAYDLDAKKLAAFILGGGNPLIAYPIHKILQNISFDKFGRSSYGGYDKFNMDNTKFEYKNKYSTPSSSMTNDFNSAVSSAKSSSIPNTFGSGVPAGFAGDSAIARSSSAGISKARQQQHVRNVQSGYEMPEDITGGGSSSKTVSLDPISSSDLAALTASNMGTTFSMFTNDRFRKLPVDYNFISNRKQMYGGMLDAFTLPKETTMMHPYQMRYPELWMTEKGKRFNALDQISKLLYYMSHDIHSQMPDPKSLLGFTAEQDIEHWVQWFRNLPGIKSLMNLAVYFTASIDILKELGKSMWSMVGTLGLNMWRDTTIWPFDKELQLSRYKNHDERLLRVNKSIYGAVRAQTELLKDLVGAGRGEYLPYKRSTGLKIFGGLFNFMKERVFQTKGMRRMKTLGGGIFGGGRGSDSIENKNWQNSDVHGLPYRFMRGLGWVVGSPLMIPGLVKKGADAVKKKRKTKYTFGDRPFSDYISKAVFGAAKAMKLGFAEKLFDYKIRSMLMKQKLWDGETEEGDEKKKKKPGIIKRGYLKTKGAIKGAAKWTGKTMDKGLKSVLSILPKPMANALYKGIHGFIDGIGSVLSTVGGWIKTGGKKLWGGVKFVGKTVAKTGQLVSKGLGGLFSILRLVGGPIIGAIFGAIGSLIKIPSAIPIVGNLITGGLVIWGLWHFRDKIKASLKFLGVNIDEMKESVVKKLGWVGTLFKGTWKKIKAVMELFKPAIDSIKEFVNPMFEKLKTMFQTSVGFIATPIIKALQKTFGWALGPDSFLMKILRPIVKYGRKLGIEGFDTIILPQLPDTSTKKEDQRYGYDTLNHENGKFTSSMVSQYKTAATYANNHWKYDDHDRSTMTARSNYLSQKVDEKYGKFDDSWKQYEGEERIDAAQRKLRPYCITAEEASFRFFKTYADFKDDAEMRQFLKYNGGGTRVQKLYNYWVGIKYNLMSAKNIPIGNSWHLNPKGNLTFGQWVDKKLANIRKLYSMYSKDYEERTGKVAKPLWDDPDFMSAKTKAKKVLEGKKLFKSRVGEKLANFLGIKMNPNLTPEDKAKAFDTIFNLPGIKADDNLQYDRYWTDTPYRNKKESQIQAQIMQEANRIKLALRKSNYLDEQVSAYNEALENKRNDELSNVISKSRGNTQTDPNAKPGVIGQIGDIVSNSVISNPSSNYNSYEDYVTNMYTNDVVIEQSQLSGGGV